MLGGSRMLDDGFFFFKQKTAYEMRISDWSSDVCSSDLVEHRIGQCVGKCPHPPGGRLAFDRRRLGRMMAAQRGDDRRRQRPRVVFELRQIADRQPEPRRHRRLAEPEPAPQRASPFAGVAAGVGPGGWLLSGTRPPPPPPPPPVFSNVEGGGGGGAGRASPSL